MKHSIYNEKGELVGTIDKGVYWTQRDNHQNQIFRKFGNALAISNYILKRLLQNDVRLIAILVVNFKQNSFYAVSTLKYFLNNSSDIDFDKKDNLGLNKTCYGKQKMMEMGKWKEVHSTYDIFNIKIEKQSELYIVQ